MTVDATAPPEDTEDAPLPARPAVLVAEDDDELRGLIVRALQRNGFAAVGAGDGQELLRALGTGVLGSDGRAFPDAVITDLRMPGFGGLEVLGVMKAAGVRLPVIAITAFGDAETHAAAFQAGASVVLDKPFSIRVLLATVHYLLDQSE